MRLTVEGQELIQAIRRGLDFEIPRHATVNIISGRGSNEDRAEIEWSLDGSDECPFTPGPDLKEADVDPNQEALPIETEEPAEVDEPEVELTASEEPPEEDPFA